MKIAILTQPLRSNYGGILQNWALQQVLLRLGHQPITVGIDPRHRDHIRQEAIRCVIHNVLRTRGRHVCHLPRWYDQGVRHMLHFVKERINSTKPRDIDHLRLDQVQADAYLVGSDQVWRPRYNRGGQLELMFGVGLPTDVPIAAYAASLGVDDWELSPVETEMAHNALQRFRGISVREASAVGLLRDHLGVKAEHVLDPTLMLTADDYRTLISDKHRTLIPDNALGVFILDMTDERRSQVEQAAAQTGLTPFYFGASANKAVTPSSPMPPVEQWLAAFDRCHTIITDSFHGTAFAINFRRPFVTLVNESRGAARFTSLLATAGLPPRFTLDALHTHIDWASVESCLNMQRQSSLSFLQNVLK